MRYLVVQVAPDNPADGDPQHDPERDTGETMEFERRVQRDHKRRGEPEQNVKIKPVARVALPAKPGPALAQGVEKDHQEHNNAEHPKLDADASAGLEQRVLRHERTVVGAGGVVVNAVGRDSNDQSDRDDVADEQAKLVTCLGIAGVRQGGRDWGWGGSCAHFWATCSSVATENCL